MCQRLIIFTFVGFLLVSTYLMSGALRSPSGVVYTLQEMWYPLAIVNYFSSIYGLVLVCVKHQDMLLLFSWILFSVLYTLINSITAALQILEGNMDPSATITRIYIQVFSISACYVVCRYYHEFIYCSPQDPNDIRVWSEDEFI